MHLKDNCTSYYDILSYPIQEVSNTARQRIVDREERSLCHECDAEARCEQYNQLDPTPKNGRGIGLVNLCFHD